jgi:hypothetical protein
VATDVCFGRGSAKFPPASRILAAVRALLARLLTLRALSNRKSKHLAGRSGRPSTSAHETLVAFLLGAAAGAVAVADDELRHTFITWLRVNVKYRFSLCWGLDAFSLAGALTRRRGERRPCA